MIARPSRVALGLTLALALAAPAARAQDRPPAPEAPRIERLELDHVRLDEALRLIADAARLNLVVTPEAGAREVTVLLQDLPVRQAIEAICKTNGLWFQEDGGVLRIMTAAEYQRDLRVVREPRTRVFDLHHPNPVAVASAIRDLFGPRVRLSYGVDEQELGLSRNQGGALGTGGGGGGALIPATGARGGGFSTPVGGGVTNLLGGAGFQSASLGGGAGATQEEDATRLSEEGLTPEQLARLRVEDGRVVSEVEGLTEGRPPIAVTVNRRHNLVVVRTSDGEAMAEIERLVLELDRPLPQVLLEMKVLEVRLGDDFQSVVDVDWVDGPTRPNLPTSHPANPLLPTAASVAEQIGGAGNFPLLGGTLLYQYLDEHVRVRLQMLARDNRVSVLATPLLLCANDEVARIFVGEERPLVRNFQLQTTTTNGVVTNQVVPVVDLRDIGQTLRLIPRINADRTVTLTILQDMSTVNAGGAILPVPTGSGGITSFSVDTVNTANLQGTVVGQDGLTLMVGGLIRKEWIDAREGVPYLMDLPLLGWLFGSTRRSQERRELVLLITPYVVMTPAEGEARSRARLEALSLHPWVDEGDRALERDEPSDVPGASGYRLLIEDYLVPLPEPRR